MIKKDFLDDIKQNCSDILYLSSKHMLDKVYSEHETIKEESNIEFFSNYKNYHIYLNDYAGTIYSKYASSINKLYIEMCNHLNIDVDNKYTLDHTVIKLEKQTPQLLLGLTDEDIQKQTILHFDEKLIAIGSSTHYNENIHEFKPRIDKLKANISLVKNALKIT